jgi:hypothetical protein
MDDPLLRILRLSGADRTRPHLSPEVLTVLRRFTHTDNNGRVTTDSAWGRAQSTEPTYRMRCITSARRILMGMTSVRVPDDMLSRLESTATTPWKGAGLRSGSFRFPVPLR